MFFNKLYSAFIYFVSEKKCNMVIVSTLMKYYIFNKYCINDLTFININILKNWFCASFMGV